MYQKAITEFEKARDLSEGNSETIASLGHAYAQTGRQDAARCPRFASVLWTLTWVAALSLSPNFRLIYRAPPSLVR